MTEPTPRTRKKGPFFMRGAELDFNVPLVGGRFQTTVVKPAVDARPLLISVKELARVLGVSTRTAWRLDAGARIPSPVQVGGLKRWRSDEVVAWIAEGCPPRRDWRWNGCRGGNC